MISQERANEVLQELAQGNERGAELRRKAMVLLSNLPNYDWSGIYRLEGDTLVLDEYVGEATDHTRIAVGVGVCGTAVAEDKNQVIEDVRELTNYLACSTKTRSEIVVLIRRGEDVLGQIDIDGHEVGTFDHSDEEMLGSMADVLAQRWD